MKELIKEMESYTKEEEIIIYKLLLEKIKKEQ